MLRVSEQDALEMLRDQGVLVEGHFVGTQGGTKGMGLHLTEYIEKMRLIVNPDVIVGLADGIAHVLHASRVDVIASPVLGAVTLGSDVAQNLGVDFAVLEHDEHGVATVKRVPFREALAGRRVAIVEDTVSDGKTAREAIAAVNMYGHVVALGCVWNRNGRTAADLGLNDGEFHPLINVKLPSWTREQCLVDGPCSKGVPINLQPGHGHDLQRLEAGQGYSFV